MPLQQWVLKKRMVMYLQDELSLKVNVEEQEKLRKGKIGIRAI